MVIFHSYVRLPEGNLDDSPVKSQGKLPPSTRALIPSTASGVSTDKTAANSQDSRAG